MRLNPALKFEKSFLTYTPIYNTFIYFPVRSLAIKHISSFKAVI